MPLPGLEEHPESHTQSTLWPCAKRSVRKREQISVHGALTVDQAPGHTLRMAYLIPPL